MCSGIRTRKVRDSRTMAGMRRMQRPSPTESPLLFEVDPQPLEETLTALGGIPLVVQAFRSLGLPGSVQQHGCPVVGTASHGPFVQHEQFFTEAEHSLPLHNDAYR